MANNSAMNFKKIQAKSDALVSKLVNETHVPAPLAFNLTQYTRCMARPDTGYIDESIFMAVLSKCFGIMGWNIVRKMFEGIKTNAKGATVEEVSKVFCIFYSEDINQKIDFIFRIYDVDRDGRLDIVELTLWLKSCTVVIDDEIDNFDPIHDLIQMTAESLSITAEGPITLEIFRAKVKKNPLFIEILGHCLPSSDVAKKFLDRVEGKSLTEMKKTFGNIRQKLLFELPYSNAVKHYPITLELP